MTSRRTLRIRRQLMVPLTLAVLAAVLVAGSVAGAASTERVSERASGKPANGASDGPATSATGRFVAFVSAAGNLVKNDSNGHADVFVRDRRSGKVRRMSVRSNGAQADARSFTPDISGSGRFVVFESRATNLVKNDTNATSDIFVRDRKTGKTRRVSIHSNGAQSNDESYNPAISANGRFVVFASFASNLIGSDTNGHPDVFIHDRKRGKTRIVSVHTNGTQGNAESDEPAVSADGRLVAFDSDASNLATDTNSFRDIFVHNRKTGRTKLVSRRTDGAQVNADSVKPAISADGRFVAFESESDGYVGNDTNGQEDIFLRDRRKDRTKRMSVDSSGLGGTGSSSDVDMSASGRWVVFRSFSKLVANDTNGTGDIFVRDRVKKKTRRVSVRPNGKQANGASLEPTISADGRHAAFGSLATNIIKPDTNGVTDVFRRGPLH